MTSSIEPLRVVVAGGGVAGLEAILALRELAGERVEISLLAPAEHFSYRPFTVGEPFSLSHGRRVPLAEIARDLDVAWKRDALAEVDDAQGEARTAGGEVLPFDALIIAVGGTPVAAVEHALTWWPEGDPEALGGLLRDVEEGYVKRVAFVVPPGAVWPLPTYELALMTAREAAGMGVPVEVTVVTPEDEPLVFLGDAAAQATRQELADAGIQLVTGADAQVRTAPQLAVETGTGAEPVEVDRVVAVPGVVGPRIPGVAADADGFIVVDDQGLVEGARRTWAAGDGIAFPIKFGGLATQQATTAATQVARMGGADVGEPEPLTLSGVLMTGRTPTRLSGEGRPKPEHVPLWWPTGKVAGHYLPRFLGERGDAPPLAPEPPADEGIVVRRRFDLRGPEASWLYDVTKPLRRGDSAEVREFGRRMHEEQRRMHPDT